MNGYQMTADSYRTLLEREKDIDRASIESKIKALDFLATSTEEERLELFNSSAFNYVVKGYVKMAMDNVELEDGSKIEDETKRAIVRELNYLFDTVTADQAEDYYNTH